MKKKWRACVFSVMALGGVIIAGPVLAAPQEEAQQIIIQKEEVEQAGNDSEKARLAEQITSFHEANNLVK